MRPRSIAATTLLIAPLVLSACSPSSDDPQPTTPDDAPAQTTADTAPETYVSPHDLTVTLADQPLRTFEQSLRDDAPPLIIEVHAEGQGDPCPDDALAHIAFVARFADGTEWDSSERRRITLPVPLGEYGVIDGLRAAITGMKIGETRRARIPWQLAYGTQGRPPIPARADLIFDIRLAAFEQPTAQPEEAP